jgi:hypothetical protein
VDRRIPHELLSDPRLVQDSYRDVALRIGARIGGIYGVVFWADNLLDEQIVNVDAVVNLFNETSYQSFLAAQRGYGATVRMRF